MREIFIGLLAGVLFGAGLALSGMSDPTRVRAFLDIFGRWDPTLVTVMIGAIIPMSLAWAYRQKMERPFMASHFALPDTQKLDAKLAVGAILFGIGWGISGLCPGPALTGLALSPSNAITFTVFMLLGMFVARIAAEWQSD